MIAAGQAQASTQQADTIVTQDGVKITMLPPLFEYPVAPDNLDWTQRSEWLIEHFWDNFDFKQKAEGQTQLNHAMKTYTLPMHFAPAQSVMKSVDKLLGKLKKNPNLLLQFTMAAEKNMYDPLTSEAIIDEVYLPFLQALAKDKKIPAARKARYKSQLSALQGSLVGDNMKSFSYTDRYGAVTKYNPAEKYTLFEFGDPDCNECRILRINLETDKVLTEAAQSGKLDIYFIIPDVDPEEDSQYWKDMVKDYPHFWNVGAASELDSHLDLRYTPCLYLIGPDKKIMIKNASLDEVKQIISETN